jgi:hypothetical protein
MTTKNFDIFTEALNDFIFEHTQTAIDTPTLRDFLRGYIPVKKSYKDYTKEVEGEQYILCEVCKLWLPATPEFFNIVKRGIPAGSIYLSYTSPKATKIVKDFNEVLRKEILEAVQVGDFNKVAKLREAKPSFKKLEEYAL